MIDPKYSENEIGVELIVEIFLKIKKATENTVAYIIFFDLLKN